MKIEETTSSYRTMMLYQGSSTSHLCDPDHGWACKESLQIKYSYAAEESLRNIFSGPLEMSLPW